MDTFCWSDTVYDTKFTNFQESSARPLVYFGWAQTLNGDTFISEGSDPFPELFWVRYDFYFAVVVLVVVVVVFVFVFV